MIALSAPLTSQLTGNHPGLDYASATATMPAMADWRQIQARIRKAKNSPDAHAKLSELYQRTHDGMVAWELALIQEKAELTDEAVKWYTVAAEKFRRAEWKKKAEEALTRLGAVLPAGSEMAMDAQGSAEEPPEHSFRLIPTRSKRPRLWLSGKFRESADEGLSSESPPNPIAAASESDDPAKKKRRRGRRGGRGRRRKGAGSAPGLPSQAFAESERRKPHHPCNRAHRTKFDSNLPEPLPQHRLFRTSANAAYEPAVIRTNFMKRRARNKPRPCCRPSAQRMDGRAIPRWLHGCHIWNPCCAGWWRARCIAWTLKKLPLAREYSCSQIPIRSPLTMWKPARRFASAWETWSAVCAAAQAKPRGEAGLVR